MPFFVVYSFIPINPSRKIHWQIPPNLGSTPRTYTTLLSLQKRHQRRTPCRGCAQRGACNARHRRRSSRHVRTLLCWVVQPCLHRGGEADEVSEDVAVVLALN